MTKNIICSLFTLLIFLGCDKDEDIVQIDLRQSQGFTSGDYNLFLQSIAIPNLEKALQFSQSRFQYYKSHFVDSYDPYSGITTLPEWCSDKIYFHEEPFMDKEGFWNYALFPQDNQRNPGCLDSSIKSLLLIRYCKDEEKIFSIWLSSIDNQDIILKPVAFSCSGSLRYN